MTTKYYYNGKLIRTSTSSKLSYNYAIVSDVDGTAANFSSKAPWKLWEEISKQIQYRQRYVAFAEERISTGLDTKGNPLSAEDLARYEKYLPEERAHLAWWKAAKVVDVEKVVID